MVVGNQSRALEIGRNDGLMMDRQTVLPYAGLFHNEVRDNVLEGFLPDLDNGREKS